MDAEKKNIGSASIESGNITKVNATPDVEVDEKEQKFNTPLFEMSFKKPIEEIKLEAAKLNVPWADYAVKMKYITNTIVSEGKRQSPTNEMQWEMWYERDGRPVNVLVLDDEAMKLGLDPAVYRSRFIKRRRISNTCPTDEFGYQIINIEEELVGITFPDGKTLRCSTEMLQSIIKEAFTP